MKPFTLLQVPEPQGDDGGTRELSGAVKLRREIASLGEWLASQGLDLQNDHAHAHEGSRDRLYLRYGYFMGLKHALGLLTNCGQTLH